MGIGRPAFGRPSAVAARFDRRTFLKLVGAAAAGVVAAEAFGVARHAGAASATSPIDDLALQLEFDQERIFRFVADRIRYEPYAGILRGAEGTLMARSGNAADQAVLLAALLKASGIGCRFARGPIDETTASSIMGSALIDEAEARQEFVDAITGTGEGSRPIRSEDVASAGVAIDPAAAPTQEVLDWANERLAMMVATVEGSLIAAGIDLPTPSAAIPDLERSDHVWIQALAGPTWLDLDPSVPGAVMGEARSTAASNHDVMPEDLRHRLRFDVVAETVSGGALVEDSTLEVEDFADALANQPIGLLNIERDGLKGLGATILSGLEGGTTYVPCLVVGETVLVGSGAIRFGGSGDGPFDELAAGTPGPKEGEPIAQWLQVTISSPGREERVVRRPIFDRLGPATRSAGPVDLAAIEPAELVQVRPGALPDFMPARSTHWLTVHTGTLGGHALGEALSRQDTTSALANLPLGFHVFREAGGLELGIPNGLRTFVDGPDLVGVTVDQRFAEDRVASGLSLDIWHRSLAAHPVADIPASTDPGVLAGVLPHLIERLMAGEASRKTEERPAASVGSLFEAAAREGISTIVVRDADRLDALPFAPDATARLRSALANGLVAIVPERPPAAAAGRVGWWLVDPTTGRTVDEMDDGRGTVSDYAATIRMTAVEAAGPMEDLGLCVGLTVLIGAITLVMVGAMAGSVVAANAGQGLAAGLLGAAGSVGLGGLGGAAAGELAGDFVSC